MPKRLLYYFLYQLRIYKATNLFRKKPVCAILAYHRVCPIDNSNLLLKATIVEPKTFDLQIGYVKKYFRVISLEELSASLLKRQPLPGNSVVITFDDAYEDNYTHAFPVLKKYGLPATIFIPTAFIEKERVFWWERLIAIINSSQKKRVCFRYKGGTYILKFNNQSLRERSFRSLSSFLKQASVADEDNILNQLAELCCIKDAPAHSRVLSWEQIREMRGQGITFGAHTHTHRNLSVFGKKELLHELNISREILERNLKEKINNFAYPYGEEDDFNTDTIRAVIESGYKNALTMCQGLVSESCDIYKLKRIGIGGHDTREMFRLKINGLIPLSSIPGNIG